MSRDKYVVAYLTQGQQVVLPEKRVRATARYRKVSAEMCGLCLSLVLLPQLPPSPTSKSIQGRGFPGGALSPVAALWPQLPL